METLLKKINSTYVLNLISALFFITFLIYSNTLLNGLFFDDEQFIYKNQSVINFSVSDFFTNSLVTGGGQLSNYYRPLLFTAFSIDYKLFGDSGFIYHFSSVMIHIAGGIILLLFLTKLSGNRALAFLTSLLWLIHPVQTEAVSYASGRGDPLSFFFVLLTLYLSLFKTRKTIFLASVAFILALLSKEIALITPILMLMIHLIQQKKISKKTISSALLISVPFIIIAASYFLLRLTVLNFANTLNFYNSENIYSGSLFVRINTFFHLLPTYLALLVFPKDLFIERDVLIKVQPLPTIISVTSFLTVLLMGIGAIWLWIVKRSYFLFFSLLWFFIAFLPTMGIIPINGIFYEHFLYYPSVGFFFLFSFLFLSLRKRASPLLQNVFLGGLLLAIILLGLRTISRNAEWRDPITFYKQTVSHAPSARIYNNLAMAYAETGQQEKAIATYKKSIQLLDVYPETHFNLGNAYLQKGDLKNAENEYQKSLTLNPYFYLAHLALYKLYTKTGNEEKRERIIKQVKTIAEKNPRFLPVLKSLINQN